MAGDWIKVECSTSRKAEVLRMAEMLGVSRRECMGLLMDYWSWLDANARTEFVPNLSRKSLDDVLQCAGLASCLESVGWAKWSADGWTMQVVNYDHHNGTSAKTRASDARKKRISRGQNRDKNGTREEKEKSIKPTTLGFAKFWATWPQHKRKAGKPQCITHWESNGLEERADRIVAHVEAMRRSVDWTKDGGQFIPAPIVYLRQQRYDAPAEVAPLRQKEVI